MGSIVRYNDDVVFVACYFTCYTVITIKEINMSVYYLKPIVWNTNNYQRPSGVRFTGVNYPAQHGFGHEEWNNSPTLTFQKNGEDYRVFHTERFGNQPLDDLAGDIFVFMIASHDGGQYLVGVAGGATSLISDQHQNERNILVNQLGTDERWQEAWAVQNVKDCYDNDLDAFIENCWKEDLHWIPNWRCPANLFLWLETPLLLDPSAITGKKRLVGMFGAYQKINRGNALDILTSVNQGNDTDILENLRTRCSTDGLDVITDVAQIEKDGSMDTTTKKSLIDARRGHGRFRQNLMRIWNKSCAVTGCAIPELLRASHIKPWRDSTNRQRLDPNNGLLLEANLDALFDSGLILFDDNGDMLVSARLTTIEKRRLRIPSKLRNQPNNNQCNYLDHHRKKVFR
jgi:hypothetical protein